MDDERTRSNYIRWLADEAADIRFWAAFSLNVDYLDGADRLTILALLDRLVAFDTAIPIHFGWHVGREALNALEKLYYQPFQRSPRKIIDANGKDYYEMYEMWLISPTIEYFQFSLYRKVLEPREIPPFTLKIDPDWLAAKLRERWPDILLNVREPRPQAYLLDWQMTIDDRVLIGGLHRDGYGIVITGYAINLFAAWYRGIIDPAEPLYLYEWAGDAGFPLTPGITPDAID